MRRIVACTGVVALGMWFGAGCSGSSGGSGFGDDGGGTQGDDDSGVTIPMDAHFGDVGTINNGDSSPTDTGTVTMTTTIYANTDTELYSMDPMTMAVTDIGAFSGMTACGSQTTITDLAVNSTGDVYANTECAIYKAAVPTSPGPVPLTLVTTLTGTNKFYALAFAPAGVLGTGEGLVAGDSNGELWYIDTSTSSSAPQDLGGFGTDQNNKAWELSGDLAFYVQGTTPAGVATIRYKTTGSTDDNDVLAGIDVSAMTANFNAHTSSTSLNLGLYGTGSTFGDLFGVGVVGSDVYAFSRKYSSTAAQLIRIDSTGVGMSIQTFSNITSGWSGAGVTTKVTVTITPPPAPP